MKELPSLGEALASCVSTQRCDMFSYSGRIYGDEVSQFITFILQRKRNENVSVVLTTYGGDAHAAYRMARSLQSFFSGTIRVLIVGPCKSAGTLVAIGARDLDCEVVR
jgi:ClpP class serine protease